MILMQFGLFGNTPRKSEYRYGRGERRLVINTKESAHRPIDGKLVHSINISIFFVRSYSAH
jgi:hypothetical protein